MAENNGWKGAEPHELNDDELLMRVARDKPRKQLACFASLAFLAAATLVGHSAPNLSAEQSALLKTPAIEAPSDGGELGYAEWTGVDRDEKSVLSAALSMDATKGAIHKTERAATVDTDEHGAATVVVGTQIAQSPPEYLGKNNWTLGRDFAPNPGHWLVGDAATVKIEPIDASHWKVSAQSLDKNPGVLWIYATGVGEEKGQPMIEARAGFVSQSFMQQTQKARHVSDQASTAVGWLIGLGVISAMLSGIWLDSGRELKKRMQSSGGLRAKMEERALRRAVNERFSPFPSPSGASTPVAPRKLPKPRL